MERKSTYLERKTHGERERERERIQWTINVYCIRFVFCHNITVTEIFVN